MPRVNKKPVAIKAKFCANTIFSHYFKIRAKKFHAAKPLTFLLFFLFWRDKKRHFNLTSITMQMCEQILKTMTAPLNNSNFLNCRKTKRRPIEAPAIFLQLLVNALEECIAKIAHLSVWHCCSITTSKTKLGSSLK